MDKPIIVKLNICIEIQTFLFVVKSWTGKICCFVDCSMFNSKYPWERGALWTKQTNIVLNTQEEGVLYTKQTNIGNSIQRLGYFNFWNWSTNKSFIFERYSMDIIHIVSTGDYKHKLLSYICGNTCSLYSV